MKKYEQALILVTELDVKDIITASTGGWNDDPQNLIKEENALNGGVADFGWSDLFTPGN